MRIKVTRIGESDSFYDERNKFIGQEMDILSENFYGTKVYSFVDESIADTIESKDGSFREIEGNHNKFIFYDMGCEIVE